MNLRTFGALLARDAHVARRNLGTVLLQTLLQPLLIVFVFGRVLTSSGLMAGSYKSILLPGIIGMSMLFTGLQAVAMPLIAEFQFTREIEDRLLAPIQIEWVAVEKVLAGALQALVSGVVVLPAGWLLLGRGVGLRLDRPFWFAAVVGLVAVFAAAGGLTLGSSVGQTQIGLMFTLVLAPMISFGCVYYPWRALASFRVLQMLVLLNPLVYASEGLRATMAPQVPHLSIGVVVAALAAVDGLLIAAGFRQFRRKAVS